MLLQGHKKVHITAIGVEVNRVVLPIKEIGADKVILVENLGPSKDYTPFVDAVEKKLVKLCPNCIVERARMDLFEIEHLIGQLGKLIEKEKACKNQVFLNVSVGSRLYDAAGVIASLMFGAVAYYAEAKTYWQDISIYSDKKGEPLGTVKEIKYTIEIPQFSIRPPPKDWIRFVSVLDRRIRDGKSTTQSAVAGDLQEMELISRGAGNGKSADNREAIRVLSELRRKFVGPMVKEGWICIEGQRRSARLKLTDQGARMLNIFAPVMLDETRAEPAD